MEVNSERTERLTYVGFVLCMAFVSNKAKKNANVSSTVKQNLYHLWKVHSKFFKENTSV